MSAGSERTAVERTLQPVRAALLADAEREAAEIRAAARTAADALIAEAEREVATAVEQERERARRSARARADHNASDARRAARQLLQAAGESERTRLIQALHATIGRLRDDDRYPQLVDALERRARAQLGDGADLRRDPAGRGGIVGRAGPRSVDYTLDALADRALAALGEEVATLCSPHRKPDA